MAQLAEKLQPEIEPLRIHEALAGDNIYHFLAVEHDRQTWVERSLEVKKIVSPYGIIIPEYFPPEFETDEITQRVARNYVDLNYLFDELPKLITDKEVRVLDPAYNKEFGFLARVPTGLLGLGTAMKTMHKLYEVIDRNPKISRRSVLKAGLFLGAAIPMGVSVNMAPEEMSNLFNGKRFEKGSCSRAFV